jgi:hypothetical protein
MCLPSCYLVVVVCVTIFTYVAPRQFRITSSRLALGAHPVSYPIATLVKRQGHKADHSASTSVEIKNTWIYTSTPPYTFMAYCLVKHRDSFVLMLPLIEQNSGFNLNSFLTVFVRSRDSSVGIATGYGLDDRRLGVRVPVGSRIFSSPRSPDRLWGPPSLLSNVYWGLFFWG